MVTSLLCLALLVGQTQPTKPTPPAFWVRPGYQVTVAAVLPGARFMEFGDDGTLYISKPNPGEIYAFKDKNKDGFYELQTTFLDDKPTAHGLCFEGGWLWYSLSGEIWKARDTNGDGKADEDIAVIEEGKLPSGGGHWWRSLLVTGDAIFTSLGYK